MSNDKPSVPQVELNGIIRENRVDDYPSTNRSLGMRPLEFGPGTSRWLWEAPPDSTINPFGTMQGGYLAVYIDEILSTAIGSVLEEGEWAVTAELKLSYLRAVLPRRLEGSGRVIRRTRSIAFMDAEIRDGSGELAVAASSTWAISRFKT
jgi:uncharacterized protein (TIGR00369 family)